MITVGIIDIDEKERIETKENISKNDKSESTIPIHVLFDQETLASSRHNQIPDVMIIDIDHQDSLIVERVKSLFPRAEILVLTNNCDVRVVRSCFRQGAVGYMLKKTCLQSLKNAITMTLGNGSFISPSVNRALIEQAFSAKRSENLLTARELQIANGILEGLSYKMIAQKYAISLDTVRIYIKRIYRKFQINSKGELIAQLTS
ncbi:MAG: response regulator transcription factor [Sphingobacterium sp.]|jgi:DNA-binding NarL/FixJ family response regulator|uniref:response regulator transcription factor n=1 Tax=Sphingobacterium sp. TaxID=341027 RepID=UPI002850A1FC|nr:response regulator transcription factor [Sphingobacterium sp.]MDR3011559.1 response regulator transcription factor [Sphingobacterium sp.]